MANTLPALTSSTTPQPADANHCSGHSCARHTTTRPIIEWDNAWGTEPNAYEAPEHALLEARDLFQRILPAWAMDVLRLKAAGLDRPTHTDRSRPALASLPIRPASAPIRKAA